MRPEQWREFRNAAAGLPAAQPPVALIADSPWIPGFAGIGHLDYYADPEAWFQANLAVLRRFPGAIFLPGWFVEYGMATEPSAFGARLHFYPDQPPAQTPVLLRIEDAACLAPVNPLTDGLMPLVLQGYRSRKQRVFEAGYTIPLAAARGPLCTAAFVRGVNEFMMDTADNPAAVHRFLRLTTDATIAWLHAQAEAIGPSVEGILVLDDIVGFLSRRAYLEFAHPCLKRICDAFPGCVRIFHNDANVKPFLADLPDTGFDVLNFSHNVDIAAARAATAGRIRLMGNVAPLDIGVRGAPEQVKAAALEVLRKTGGEGVILSVGGGVSPGMPAANIDALVEAAREFATINSYPPERP